MLLTVATAGLGVLLAHFTGLSLLEGYLATSPGGVYAVLATAVDTGALPRARSRRNRSSSSRSA